MPALHMELNFEDELVGHLIKEGGWIAGDPKKYDRALGIYTEDVIGWIQDTQPTEYEKVKGAQNGATDSIILDRLAKALQEQGPLSVLRNGFTRVNARFAMCAFKPGHGLNPETMEKNGKVRCRVVRQVRYSENNGNSIDLEATGTAQFNISSGSVGEVAIRIPPITEQHAIVRSIADHQLRIAQTIQAARRPVSFTREHSLSLTTAVASDQIDVNTYKSQGFEVVA